MLSISARCMGFAALASLLAFSNMMVTLKHLNTLRIKKTIGFYPDSTDGLKATETSCPDWPLVGAFSDYEIAQYS